MRGRIFLISLLLFILALGALGSEEEVVIKKKEKPWTFNYGDANSLKFEITTNKKQYMPYEPIFVTVKLTNISHEQLDVFLPLYYTIQVNCKIIGPDDKAVPMRGLPYDWSPMGSSTQPLAAGQSVSLRMNLFDYYIPSRPGKYLIKTHYNIREEIVVIKEGKQHDWSRKAGELVAQCQIRILEPKKKEDQEALVLFSLAVEDHLRHPPGVYPLPIFYDQITETRLTPGIYKKIIEKYPRSIYAEYASYYLAKYMAQVSLPALRTLEEEPIIGYLAAEQAEKLYKEFMEKYPKSAYFEIAKKELDEFLPRRKKLLIEKGISAKE